MTKTQEIPAEAARATDTFALIHPGLIVPDPNNVRDELTDIEELALSIFQLGLQQPLRVRLVPHGFLENDPTAAVYVIIAGHRRFAAIQLLIARNMWSGDVACMLAPEDISADDVTASMLVENLQRADLNPVEEAKAFERLTKEFRYKRAELAAKIARSESYIADRLALLKLPQSIQDSVSAGHYPMTHALLLKGLPASVIEQLTKGGRTIVTDTYAINRAVKSYEYETLKAALLAAGAKSGIEALGTGTNRYEFRNSSDLIATFSTLEDAKLLAKYEGAPKGARLVTDDNPYNHSFSIELRKPLTAKQIEAREAKKAEARTAEQEAKEKAAQERYEAEAATWSDEYREWVATCDRLQAEHIAATDAYEEAIEQARTAWSTNVDPKKVARFAMLSIFNDAGWHELRPILDLLGLDHDGQDERTVAQRYVEGDARRLTQVVALLLALPTYGQIVSEPANEDMEAYIASLNIVEPEELVLPDEPTDTPKETADDPIHDVA